MSVRVGLTGGVACGKSTVAEMLREFGAHIIDADEVARELVLPGHPALQAIVTQFGSQYLLNDGTLDRAGMRALVFSDSAAKKWLEALLHPQIRQTFITRSKRLEINDPEAIIVWVVPLLIENDYLSLIDTVLVIDCPQSVQVQRLRARSGWSDAQISAVLAAQCGRDQRNAAADRVIANDGSLDTLRHAIIAYADALKKSRGFA
ncbi:MAG: dephospho-CoA kinase [Acidithiobacillus sp.]